MPKFRAAYLKNVFRGLFLALTALAVAGPALAATVRDDLDRLVDVPAIPRRIICLTPALAETCFALGLGDKIVGVAQWSDYPPEAGKVQRIGSYVSPNLELIAALAPDLVLADRESNPAWVVEQLDRAGIPVFVVWSRDLAELEQNFIDLGRVTGAPDQGLGLARDFRARLEKIRARLARVEKVPVLLVIQNRPVVSVGAGTLHHLLLETAGARNIAAGAPGRWPRLGPEAVIAAPPRVIVVTTMEKGAVLAEMLDFWRTMPGVGDRPDVRIESIPSDLIDRAGPRLGQGLEELVRLIHPEIVSGEVR
ncbi:MAG: helical backbone metal receptor [Pseudomonadota bacterium]